jgi:type II secretory pathway pseudopilin PulG
MVKKLLQTFKFQEWGFTFVELLVMLAILSLLAAVAVPMLTNSSKLSNTAAANEEMATVQTAVNGAFAAALLHSVTPGIFGDGTDFMVNGTYKVGDYVRGGLNKIKEVYFIGPSGGVTANATGSWPAADIQVTADGKFERKP